MKTNDLVWRIGGPAGYGLLAAGNSFAKLFTREGYHVFANTDFHSNIKGLHNWYNIRISNEPIHSQRTGIDILICLDTETAQLHTKEVTKGGVIIFDPNKTQIPETDVSEGVTLCPINLDEIAMKDGGRSIMRNTVALGASMAMLGKDFQHLADSIKHTFRKKKPEIADKNIEVSKQGYDLAKAQFAEKFDKKLPEADGNARYFISGNDSIGVGALMAGCRFISAYPMTPATSVLTYLASQEKSAGIVTKHTEDELAAMNMAIGASFAGVRAMTCTSGGGFSLMVEALGMAGMNETPIVAVNVQRPGPSTGLPTRTTQGDLRFLMHAGHGEMPRIVIAPGDLTDCYEDTIDAFNLADKYQIPVLILSDKYLGMNYMTHDGFDESKAVIDRGEIITSGLDENYKRYAFTESGISPRAIPGKGPVHLVTSYEHNEVGDLVEDEENAIKMNDKRMSKMRLILKDLPEPELVGPTDADVTLIGFGSTKMPILEAMKWMESDGLKVNYLQLKYLLPIHSNKVAEIIKNANKTICIENNVTGQLAGVIKENTGLDVDNKLLKYDGRPFYPEEIIEKVKEVLNG